MRKAGQFHQADTAWGVTLPSWDSGTSFPEPAAALGNVLEVHSTSKGTAKLPTTHAHSLGQGTEW